MATYLGIYIAPNTIEGEWLNTNCNNTAADYWYSTQLQVLQTKCAEVRAAALDSDTMGDLDNAESALWLLHSALGTLYVKARNYASWFQDLIENTGFFGIATDESCGQNINTLGNMVLPAVNIRNNILFEHHQTQNLLATIQQMQDDEINEEQIQNTLNDAANRINAERLEVEARLQEVRTLEFINNLQQVLLPLLIVSVVVVAFTRKR